MWFKTWNEESEKRRLEKRLADKAESERIRLEDKAESERIRLEDKAEFRELLTKMFSLIKSRQHDYVSETAKVLQNSTFMLRHEGEYVSGHSIFYRGKFYSLTARHYRYVDKHVGRVKAFLCPNVDVAIYTGCPPRKFALDVNKHAPLNWR